MLFKTHVSDVSATVSMEIISNEVTKHILQNVEQRGEKNSNSLCHGCFIYRTDIYYYPSVYNASAGF